MSVTMGVMDYALFLKIADQISKIKTIEKVFLHWRGEPTCCEYLDQAVRYLCACGIKVLLFTNGVTFTEKLAKKIIKTGIYAIFFSLESIDSKGYSTIRGSDKYHVLVKNIKNTVALRNKLHAQTKINISTIVFDDNLSLISIFNDYWKTIVDKIEYHADTRGSKLINSQKKQCSWPNYGMFISWDGIVSACCMDVNRIYPIGDVHNSSISDIFTSEEAKMLRKKIKMKQPIGKCRSCKLFPNSELV